MRFIPCHLQQTEPRRASRQTERLAAARQKHFFFLLREAGQCQRTQSDGGQRILRGVQLSFPAIDHAEIRQRLRLAETASEIARHNFVHRCEVIVPPLALDFELSILRAFRPSILEPDHARHRVPALRMRDVEADEAAWNHRQSELALQIVHRVDGALVALVGREFHLLQQMPRVLHREVHQLAFCAALRHQQT